MKARISVLVCVVVVGMTILSGCATTAKMPAAAVQTEETQGPQFETMSPVVSSEGSLWTDTGSIRLFSDMRAREVGDLVTVRISEKPTGKLYAQTQTSRDSSIEAGITDALGYMKALEDKNENFDRTSMFKANFKPSFTGQGTNNREGELDAYVTARVVQVLANGNLRILGRQEIMVNNETQHITISGIIRTEDIDTNNEVQSTYVADARIEYSGKGVIADKQRPGWLMRVLDRVWPF
jgi:flagellar L-ring protein precursor FlgH